MDLTISPCYESYDKTSPFSIENGLQPSKLCLRAIQTIIITNEQAVKQ
ncbi:MAG TPA: hypothetical protein VI278_08535 [Nitrososphaeraceae archaeon]|jgi:hypothetical protein